MFEYIGLTATSFVLISFLANKEKHIRIINIFGAVLFVLYGILINSPSVYILNGALILIHFYKLYNMRNEIVVDEYNKLRNER